MDEEAKGEQGMQVYGVPRAKGQDGLLLVNLDAVDFPDCIYRFRE
jgi:hypothetical protein